MTRRQRLLRPLRSAWRTARQRRNRAARRARQAAVQLVSAAPWQPAELPATVAPSMLPDVAPDLARAAIVAAVHVFYAAADRAATDVLRKAGWACG